AIGKYLRVRQREERIAAALATDGRRRFCARGGGTERTGAVRRMNNHVITERQDLVMQSAVELMGQARRVLMSEQVSTRDRPDQQAATAEQHWRLLRMARI